MTDYSVRPKSSGLKAWDGYPRVCLGISLGNSNERGDKLLSIVEWINAKFQDAIIDLSDTLYRWNEYAPDGSLAVDNETRSRARGDQWLAENRDVLSRLTVPYEVIRWDTWLKQSEFRIEYNNFKNLYFDNAEFHKAIDNDVEKFLHRQKRYGLPFNEVAKKNCHSFLFEELAAHTLLYRAFPNTVQVYPGDNLESATAIRTGRISGAPTGLPGVPFVSLRVERTSSKIPELSDRPVFRKALLPG